MLAALCLDDDQLWWLKLTDAGEADGSAARVSLDRLREVERRESPRWIVDAAGSSYPSVLRRHVRLARCHDVSLTERILLGRAGRFGEPLRAAAVVARRAGAPIPPDPAEPEPGAAPALFDLGRTPPPQQQLADLGLAYRDQTARIGSDRALRLLITAESAAALAAVEMGRAGLPFRSEVHRSVLDDLLGGQPPPGRRPPVLATLVEELTAAFGFRVNPDSPVELRDAFHRLGYDVESTRAWALRDIDHPVVPVVRRYKELSRLWTANGWNWLAEWVHDNRFHAEYLPGAVVSGRWAARGGGGLQIPHLARRAVLADPGRFFVSADAAQLEPRVLAALSSDTALQQVSASIDLYAGLAADGFGGDRAKAKVAMLAAMYGATAGEAGRLLVTLRHRYPAAMACVEDAARRGERGESVRTVLGRTSPPPGAWWQDAISAGAQPDADVRAERRAREAARSWGRFTRNFVVQGSAADWASVWLSLVRTALGEQSGTELGEHSKPELGEQSETELVLFQHDELLLHVPIENADAVCDLVVGAADRATRMVFPGVPVLLPVQPVVVECYADAK